MSKVISFLIVPLIWAATIGNIIFILWILYNGYNEGFQGTSLEKFSYGALIILLILNIILILTGWRHHIKRS
jgi:hypothetical protein